MILYYGADKLITTPTYGIGNPTNDYGMGFYLTPDKLSAKLWASKFSEDGYLITYNLSLKNLNVLYLNSNTEVDILKWITILVSHRFDNDTYHLYKENIDFLKMHFYPDVNDVDVIVGYRADDSYFAYSESFVAGEMSIEKLSEAMKLGKLGLQYVLISKKAFTKIKYVSHEVIKHTLAYQISRRETLNEYRKIKKEDSIHNTYLRDIMRRY